MEPQTHKEKTHTQFPKLPVIGETQKMKTNEVETPIKN